MAPSHRDGEVGSNRRRMKGRRDNRNHHKTWPKLAHDRYLELLGGYANDQNHRDMVDQTFGPGTTDVEGRPDNSKSRGDCTVSSSDRSSLDIAVAAVAPRKLPPHLLDRRNRQNHFLRSSVGIVAVVAALVMATVVGYVVGGFDSAAEGDILAQKGPKIGKTISIVNPKNHQSRQKGKSQQRHHAIGRYPLRSTNVQPKLSKDKFLQSFFEHYPDTENCMDFKCNHDVATCDNHEVTNYEDPGPDGPCCTHILRDMLFAIDKSMGELGLDYYVGFGTLLGLVRDDKIIPWTIDNDLIMDQKTLQLMTQMWDSTATGLEFITTRMGRQLRGFPRMCITPNFAGGRLAEKWQVKKRKNQKWQVKKRRNLKWQAKKRRNQKWHVKKRRNRQWQAKKRRDQFTERGFPYTDLYIIEEMVDGTFGNEYKGCLHKKDDLFPTKRRPVYGGQFALNFPLNWEVVVQRYYGPEWRVPLTDQSQHGDQFKLCSVLYGMPQESVKI